MTDTTRDADRPDAAAWETIARHDFGSTDELDATILTALDGDGPNQPLYATVDVEPAERFLASVGGADAAVVFRIAGRPVRVSADGRVQVRRTTSE